MAQITRRVVLTHAPVVAASAWTGSLWQPQRRLSATFPTQEPELVREVVGVSHNNLARLRELVDRQPALARASWDWGFGDWESALGAASHVGNRDIALYLLERGARPSIFSAAMLGQLAVVRAFVEASPGVQRTKGPHGIPLLSHATAGGAPAAAVVEYLKGVGGADERVPVQPLAVADRDRLVGSYTFGEAADERFEVTVAREALWVARLGRSPRGVAHLGGLQFSPVGAESVRLKFAEANGVMTLTITDPDVVLVATRVTGVDSELVPRR